MNVIQLETASGAAIKSFNGALGINVPRSRFLPVKTTSDLVLIMSNLFTQKKGLLEMNPLRSFPSVPLIKLGSGFTKVNLEKIIDYVIQSRRKIKQVYYLKTKRLMSV